MMTGKLKLSFILISIFILTIVGCATQKKVGKKPAISTKELSDIKQKNDLPELEHYYLEGIQLMDECEYEKAEVAFSKVLEIDNTHVDAYNRRGFVFLCQYKYDQAISDLTKTLELSPNNTFPLYCRARAYSVYGMYTEALSDVETILEIQPDNAYAFNEQGWIYIKMKKFEDAVGWLNIALVFLKEAFIYDSRGWAFFFLGQLEEARQDALYALELDPECYYSRALLYRIEVEQGNSEEALSSLRSYLSKYEDKIIQDNSFLILKYFTNEVTLEVIKNNPDWDDLRVALEPLERTPVDIEELKQKKPSDFNYSEILGEVQKYINKKQISKAKKLLIETISKIDIDGLVVPPYVKYNTVVLYAEGDAVVGILGTAAMVKKIGGTAQDQAGFIESLYPRTFHNKAIEYTWEIVAIEKPKIPYLFYYLSYILIEEEGDLDNALIHLDTAIRLWPAFARAYLEKVFVYIKMGDFVKAKEMASEASQVIGDIDEKNQARLDRHLGFIAIEEGDLDLAEEYYEHSLELDPDNEVALKELRYIEMIRDKTKGFG